MTRVAPDGGVSIRITVDGTAVDVEDEGSSLLEVLRSTCGVTSVKDGCSPQGQCGCCTVLVDGQPRVACVTPVRRIADRSVTTLDGIDPDVRARWADAFTDCGASQCGFCTPGIIVRLEGLRSRPTPDDQLPDRTAAAKALAAHLCRCTGWQPILDAWESMVLPGGSDGGGTGRTDDPSPGGRDRAAAERRAAIEGGLPQQVGPSVALGAAPFAGDTAPDGALVAIPRPGASADELRVDPDAWVVAASLPAARLAAAKVQGRRTTIDTRPPLDLPPGSWAVTLRTSWVEPAYLETDASWCAPGGEPANPLANAGAFGGKLTSPVVDAARMLADHHGVAVRTLFDREDTVRLGPKRPPVAIGVGTDGVGVARVVATSGVAEAIAVVAPGLIVEEVTIPGPPTSSDLRGAGWVEAAIAVAAAVGSDVIATPAGGRASADIETDGALAIRLACGDPLDEVVLASYATGAAHQAIGWVTSEGLAVDPVEGRVDDLTIRSFGIPRATDLPPIRVTVDPDLGDTIGPAVTGSDAVFAAVALTVWRHQGLPSDWPTGRPLRS